MNEILNLVVIFFGFSAMASFIGMHLYLFSKKESPFLVINPFWPAIIVNYRNYTKENYGRPCLLYFLFLINIFFLIPTLILLLAFQFKESLFLFTILALLVVLPLVTAIIYVILNLSKDEFYNKLF